jgi:hypothetical protein
MLDATWEDIVKFLREFGLPTLFCLWLMWRDNKKTDVQVQQMGKVLVLVTVLAKLQGIQDDPPEEDKS